MSHVRTQIKTALKTRLTGLTTTGAKIESSRVHPFLEEDAPLPALVVFMGDEEIGDSEEAELGTQERIVDAIVVGFAQATVASLETTLDTIAAEVETAIYSDQFFNNLAKSTELISTTINIEPGANKPIGTIELIFRIEYFTREGAPEVAI